MKLFNAINNLFPNVWIGLLVEYAMLYVSLYVCVTVHEFGHYLMAKLFGLKVDGVFIFAKRDEARMSENITFGLNVLGSNCNVLTYSELVDDPKQNYKGALVSLGGMLSQTLLAIVLFAASYFCTNDVVRLALQFLNFVNVLMLVMGALPLPNSDVTHTFSRLFSQLRRKSFITGEALPKKQRRTFKVWYAERGRKIFAQTYYYLTMVLVPVIMMVAYALRGQEVPLVKMLVTTYVIMTFGVIFILRKEIHTDVKIDRNWVAQFALGLGLMLSVSFILEQLAGMFVTLILGDTVQSSLNQAIFEYMMNESPLVMSFCSVILGPIAEELIFRHATMMLFKNRKTGLIVQALLFGSMHITFTSLAELFYFPVYVVLGYIMGRLYSDSGDLRLSTAVHIGNNLISSIVSLI